MYFLIKLTIKTSDEGLEVVWVHALEWVLEVVSLPPGGPFGLGSHVGDDSGSFAEGSHSHEDLDESVEVWAVSELGSDGVGDFSESLLELIPGVDVDVVLEVGEHSLECWVVEGESLESSLVSCHW